MIMQTIGTVFVVSVLGAILSMIAFSIIHEKRVTRLEEPIFWTSIAFIGLLLVALTLFFIGMIWEWQ